MHRSVELELEEVDSIQDQELLQKANVSPFFTSSRPPYALLNELDFSPQAISRETEDVAAATTTTMTTSYHSFPPLSLDCSSLNACAGFSSSSLSAGGYELKPLSRVSSWQDLGFASHDLSTGRFYGNAAQMDDYSRSDSLLSPQYEYQRSETLDCLPSLYDGEYPGRERLSEYERLEMFERHDTHVTPLKDDFSVSESGVPGKRVIVTDSDLRLFSSSASSSAAGMRGHAESWESNSQSYLGQSAPVFRPLETPRFRREKMFPQQNNNGYLMPKSTSSACATAHRMVPFPMEPLSLAASKPKRHNALRKQSPLPDAHRTTKTKRASKNSLFCTLPKQSPMTELTKRCSRDAASAETFADRLPVCRLPGLQQPHLHISGLSELGSSSSSQTWRHERLAQFSHQQPGYYAQLPGFAIPSLQPQRAAQKRKIGAYSPEARQERIKRFHQKRKERVFHKRIKYDCRKRLANACPRIKGRFVRKQDLVDAAAQASVQVASDGAPAARSE